LTALDEKFFRRVYRTSAVVAAIAALACWSRWRAPVALALLAGTAVFLVCLYLTERGVRTYIRPGAANYRRLLFYAAIFYPLLLALLYPLVTWRSFNLPAFGAGCILPNVIIVLKALGRRIVGN